MSLKDEIGALAERWKEWGYKADARDYCERWHVFIAELEALSEDRIVHVDCGTEVEFERRGVLTQPSDEGWPKNVQVLVYFCPACRKLVDATHVRP